MIPAQQVDCIVIDETSRAYRLQSTEDPERQAWFPKSHVSFARRNLRTGAASAEISEWVLKKEGWAE